jgi:hypothetical protein
VSKLLITKKSPAETNIYKKSLNLLIEALIKKGGEPSFRTRRSNNKKNPFQVNEKDFIKKGGDILSHITAVPSAQSDLTSLFGKVRGEPRRNNHLKLLVFSSQFIVYNFCNL